MIWICEYRYAALQGGLCRIVPRCAKFKDHNDQQTYLCIPCTNQVTISELSVV